MSDAVAPDPSSLTAAISAHDGDVNRPLGKGRHPPQRRCRLVAEYCATVAREKCGGLTRQRTRRRVPDRVHAGVLDPQEPAVDHVRDRARSQARGQQLLARHETAL